MNELQWKAARPDYSIWVSASAGTGKTKILTDRVLRLLLKGADPQKILCLTFTNAAASEMQHRIESKLSKWALIEDAELRLELQSMLGEKPSDEYLQLAKELFDKSLKPHGKIEIHTIHSYCQKVLKRFPLEANVSPGFQIIDEIKAGEILKKVKNQLYLDESHSEVMGFFTANFHEVTINDILDEIIKQKLKFKDSQSAIDSLQPDNHFTAFKINIHSGSFEEIQDDCNELKKMFALTYEKVNEEEERHKVVDLDIQNKAELLSLFLTKEGDKRARIISKKLANQNPELFDECERLQEKVYQFDQSQKTEGMIKYSQTLNNLAEIFINKYEEYKRAHGFLDYDDLINATKNLFNYSHVRDWVLYKLDGGIDHLLVDEAQDTSPYQWEIIEAMITEFYAGLSARSNDRTIFVVGDEKQSIFSFQGANLESLNMIRDKLKSKLLAAQKNYENISLQYSYRSVPSIIEAVYYIFEYIKKSLPDFFPADNPKILPYRETHRGRVEIWPLVDSEKSAVLFWPRPNEHNNIVSPQKQLAVNIANFIKSEIDAGEILASTGLPVCAGDFMILVRKRDILATEIISQLKDKGLQTAGIDRMLLSENLSVMDLISIAKFVVSPQDDLNMAVLFKSPLIGLDDESINKIIDLKESKTIWEALTEENLTLNNVDLQVVIDKLSLFLKLYEACDTSNFFHIIVDSLEYRGVLVEASGADSNDAINEFLYLSYNYAYNIDNSLQSFIYWFESNEIEIKRNVQTTDKIKIMTIHASKGLQAPIVILCDTTSLPISKSKFYHTENGELIAVQQSSKAPETFNSYKEKQYHKDLQEYIRLLYVGMTRPQDHLIICGYQVNEKLSPYCWYNLVANALRGLAETDEDHIMKYESSSNIMQTTPQTVIPMEAEMQEKVQLDPRLHRDDRAKCSDSEKGKAESPQSQTLFRDDITLLSLQTITPPSSLVFSPLVDSDFLEYGKIFHKILEDSLKAKDLKNLKSHPLINILNPLQLNKINQSIDVLLKKGELKNLIDGEIRTEINIGNLNKQQNSKIGRIDLLCIKDNEVIIIDYKSDARPAISPMYVPKSYIDQLKFYSEVVLKLFPDHKVTSKILWLQNGEFMDV